MSRFIQTDNTSKPAKEAKPLPKFGGQAGSKDYSKLAESKKIISPNGGRR